MGANSWKSIPISIRSMKTAYRAYSIVLRKDTKNTIRPT